MPSRPSADHSRKPVSPGHRVRGLAARAHFPTLIARADTLNGSTAGTNSSTKPGSAKTGGYPNIVDPKVCASILTTMKDAEAGSKGNGAPPTGPKGPPASGMTSTSKSSSGATRRSKVTQNPEFHVVRRADPPASSGSPAADPNSCKELQALIKANREKMSKGTPGHQLPTKKEKESSAESKTSTDAKPTKDRLYIKNTYVTKFKSNLILNVSY
ncbi:hypothetical protein DFH28DRAFT_1217767 [Melampsora americana]|nr:hypothetical protein DFH28DRAFT_1217767 [Melampsora americana]